MIIQIYKCLLIPVGEKSGIDEIKRNNKSEN